MELPIDYPSTHFTIRKLAREEYIQRQKGMCCHCQGELRQQPPRHIQAQKVDTSLFPDNFFLWPVHLHHDHNTGLTIGAVHGYCNAVLWQHHGE